MIRITPAVRASVCALALIGTGGVRSEQRGTTPVLGLREEAPRLLAFRHARIVVAPGRTIEDGTLVVGDGRVVAVGTDVRVPDGAYERDLSGKTIFPGFIDPYTDYGLADSGPVPIERPAGRGRAEAERVGADAWNEAVHAERRWVESFVPDPKAAEGYWKRGVTTVLSVRKDGILRGRSFVASVGEGLPNDLVLVQEGPQCASFDKGSSRQAYPTSLMGSIALLRQSLHDARWYAEARAASDRDPAGPSPEVNRALAALSGDRGPFLFESEDELSLLRAARIGEDFSIRMVHVGSNREYRRLDEIAALKSPILLPVDFPAKPDVATKAAELEVSLADLRHWERAPSNPAALAARGVPFAFTAHGLATGEDFLGAVRRAIRRGLDRESALAALTTVPAGITAIADRAGTLDPGKRGDFFVADGDVLSDEDARIFSVWVAGRPAREFVPLDQYDFRGAYEVTLEARKLKLSLDGAIDRIRGRLRGEGPPAELGAVDVDRRRITFHADLTRLGGGGAARFTIVRSGEAFEASVLLPGERMVTAEVGRVAEAPEKEESERKREEAEKSDQELDRTLVSRVTFPDSAFGWTEPPHREDVLVRNATIWTGAAEGILEGADLLVRDGKIAAVGRRLEAPRGVRVVDGTGKHVTAGILDEHSHLAISRGVNEASHAITAEVRIGDVVDSDDVGIYRALAGGVTTAQLLHGSANPIGGQAQVIKLRWGLPPEGMKLAGAPPTIKLALGENVKQSNSREPTGRYPQTRMGVETILRDAFLSAREYGRARANHDALKPDERARRVPPRRDLRLDALLEILDGKRFTHVHSYVQSEILMMMRLAEEMGFRVQTFTHILEGYKVAPEMAKHGASASSFSDWWAYKFEVYDAIPYNTCLLMDHGVVTSVNSDSEDVIRRLNQEAAKSVLYCGTDPHEAWKLATLNPAIQLRIADHVGSLERGKDADFVIWSGPPLSAYSKVEETWIDGARWFALDRDAELRRAAEEERQALVQKVLRTKGGDRRREERGGEPRPRLWHCDDVEDTWNEN